MRCKGEQTHTVGYWKKWKLATCHFMLSCSVFSTQKELMTSLSAFKRSCLLARSHAISLASQGYWLNESPQHILLYIRRRLRLIYLVCVCVSSHVHRCVTVVVWYLWVPGTWVPQCTMIYRKIFKSSIFFCGFQW